MTIDSVQPGEDVQPGEEAEPGDEPQRGDEPVEEDARGSWLGRLVGPVRARVPASSGFVVGLFFGSKLLLTVVGLVVLHAYDAVPDAPPARARGMHMDQLALSSHRWISMWFAWDSFQYKILTETPLTGRWHSFGFPLLYPFMARPLAAALGGRTAIALLLISNVAFLLSLYFAVRLAQLRLGDDAAARRFTKYLVLLPTAFLFQAALTESLFVCLALAAFYYAERQRWWVVGVVGFFLALSRSLGFLAVLPLAVLLVQQQPHPFSPRGVLRLLRAGWPLVLVPGGWLAFMAFCRWQSGDWFAYQHAQEKGWQIVVQNPWPVLWHALTAGNSANADRMWFAVAFIAVAVAGVKRAELPYLLFTVLMVVMPLTIGPPVYKSLLRYLLAAFPVCLVLARWARNTTVDAYLTAGLALVQGTLFALWLTYWTFYII